MFGLFKSQEEKNKDLHYAVHFKDYEQIKKTIEKGADVNSIIDGIGLPFILFSVEESSHIYRMDTLKLLVESGLNLREMSVRNVFANSIKYNNIDFLKFLLNCNANVDFSQSVRIAKKYNVDKEIFRMLNRIAKNKHGSDAVVCYTETYVPIIAIATGLAIEKNKSQVEPIDIFNALTFLELRDDVYNDFMQIFPKDLMSKVKNEKSSGGEEYLHLGLQKNADDDYHSLEVKKLMIYLGQNFKDERIVNFYE